MPRERNQEDDLEFDLDNLDPAGNQDDGDNGDEPDDPDDEPDDPDSDEEIRAGEGDESDSEDQDDDDGDEPPSRRQPDRRPNRRDPRIQALAEDNRRERERSADLERRLNELTSRVNSGHQQPRETPEQRAARLSLMSPEDRLREEFRESNEAHTGQMRAMAFQLQDNNDRNSYEAKAARIPLYAKWADKVEDEVRRQQRENGLSVPREAVLYYLIGKQAVAGLNDPKNRQERRAAASRVRRQTTRPSNSRSDQQPNSNNRQRQSLEKRLENVQL